jgi:hypothetical protein
MQKKQRAESAHFSHKKMSIVSAEKCVFDKPFNISVSPWTIVNAISKRGKEGGGGGFQQRVGQPTPCRTTCLKSPWSMENHKNSKTTHDAYLGLDLSIHINHSSIHLVTVTQSL